MDIFQDTAAGHLIRLVTGTRFIKYAEEIEGFELPEPVDQKDQPQEDEDYNESHSRRRNSDEESRLEDEKPHTSHDFATRDSEKPRISHDSAGNSDAQANNATSEGVGNTLGNTISRQLSRQVTIRPTRTADGVILADWYYPDDPANPQNWTLGRKLRSVAILCVYTFAVYIGSSIYAPAATGVMEQFGVGAVPASLGLALYVLAYGIGPMLWSPLSEVATFGRNWIYIITFALFVILTLPAALTPTFAGLLVARFLLGFFGSPCLATCGASFQDMFSLIKLPYTMVFWVCAATMGPSLGPVIAGFSVQSENWRWSQWELLWLSGPCWIVMFLLLPETSTDNILYRRAVRLRKLYPDRNIKSQSEIDQANMSSQQRVYDALYKPWQINALDPAVLFSTFYTALLYGIYYSFFESVPLVYGPDYGFNLGESGLPFLAIPIFCALGALGYLAYWHWSVEPAFERDGSFGPQEDRLKVGLVGSPMIPIGLFLYAWTARPSVHWIAPTIGLGISQVGTFLIVQSIFMYLPFTYPKYAASLFAANDLARSALAAGAVVFSGPMFKNMGVPAGVSMLGGFTIVCVVLLALLYIYGAKLRAMSRFAEK